MKFEPIGKEDLGYLRMWRNDDSIRDWCRQVGYISTIDQIKWYEKQATDPTICMFKIVMPPSMTVGVCGLTDIDLVNRRAEFSLYIAPMHQRKGYAKEALKGLFRFGFNELNLHLIWGETFDGNPAAKMFESLGMKLEGTRRDFYFKKGKYIDAHLYSITCNDKRFAPA